MEYTATPELMSVLSGDCDAGAADFEAILRLYQPKVFRFILASVRDKDGAETLTQDCFLKAYQARHKFRHECSLDTWLMQIAVNLVRDYARNRRLQFWRRAQSSARTVEGMRDLLADGRRSPEGAAILKEEVKAVWEAAEALSSKQRTVFLLRFVEEMDLLEIAAVAGMREGTVKVHLFRAMNKLRKSMGVRP